MAELIKSGENPNAAGTLTYGIEGVTPAFVLDSAGNLTVTGALSGGGGSGFVPLATVTTKGDLIAATGSAAVSRVAVGTNGQVLTATSGAAAGVAWATPSADVPLSTFTAKGDTVAATGSGAVTRVAVGTDGQVLTADTASTGGVKWAASAGGGPVKIGSTVLGAPAANIPISIPAGYSSIVCYYTAGSASATITDDLAIRFNGDAGANYQLERVLGAGNTVAGADAVGTTYIKGGTIGGTQANANCFASGEFTMPQTGSGFYKMLTGQGCAFLGSLFANDGCYNGAFAGMWANTAVVTSVSIATVTGSNLVTGSSLVVYGIP